MGEEVGFELPPVEVHWLGRESHEDSDDPGQARDCGLVSVGPLLLLLLRRQPPSPSSLWRLSSCCGAIERNGHCRCCGVATGPRSYRLAPVSFERAVGEAWGLSAGLDPLAVELLLYPGALAWLGELECGPLPEVAVMGAFMRGESLLELAGLPRRGGSFVNNS